MNIGDKQDFGAKFELTIQGKMINYSIVNLCINLGSNNFPKRRTNIKNKGYGKTSPCPTQFIHYLTNVVREEKNSNNNGST